MKTRRFNERERKMIKQAKEAVIDTVDMLGDGRHGLLFIRKVLKLHIRAIEEKVASMTGKPVKEVREEFHKHVTAALLSTKPA